MSTKRGAPNRRGELIGLLTVVQSRLDAVRWRVRHEKNTPFADNLEDIALAIAVIELLRGLITSAPRLGSDTDGNIDTEVDVDTKALAPDGSARVRRQRL